MFRVSLIAVAFYTWGGPAFDGTRPIALDRAVRSFHGDVNHVARDAMYSVTRLQASAVGGYAGMYRLSVGPMVSSR